MPDNLELRRTWLCKEQQLQHLHQSIQNYFIVLIGKNNNITICYIHVKINLGKLNFSLNQKFEMGFPFFSFLS